MTGSVSHQLSIRRKKKNISESNTLAAPCTRKNSINSPSLSTSYADIHLEEFRILINLMPAYVRSEELKLFAKVVHDVCNCRFDSWIYKRQIVKFV